jgi:adenylate cyclase
MGSAGTFGPFVFDHATGTLSRESTAVAVGTRAAALLRALVEADGSPVSKEALMAAGWPGTFVEEGNLSVQIANLRKAMGPRPDGQDWIATVPRVGYRLLASQAPPPHAPKPQLPSLAVLPFDNLSGDHEQDYFADGVVEDIITALSRFKSFAIIARNSSFVYKGRAVDVREVAKDLGVRYVLEGSVRRAGTRLRVAAQLVDATTGAHIWAHQFDGNVDEVFAFQDAITESVAAIVEPRLRKAEIERSRRERPDSIEAYDLYLRAMSDVFSTRAEGSARAQKLLEDALALDGSFTPALAMMSTVHLLRHAMQLPGATADDASLAVTFARRALALGTDDPQALAMCGFALLECGYHYDEGLAVLRRAVDDNPNNTTVLTQAGIGCLLGGDLDEGDAYLQRGLRLNPNEFGTHWLLTGIAHIRMAQGRFEEAIEVAKRSLAVNDGYDATYWMLIAGNALLGRMEEARQALDGLNAITPGITLSRIQRGQAARDPRRIEILIEGMRLAGMRES